MLFCPVLWSGALLYALWFGKKVVLIQCVHTLCDWNDNKATLTLCVVRWAEKLDALTATASQDPEGFLGHPVNAFKLMKRLNTEWGEVEDLVLKDMSDG